MAQSNVSYTVKLKQTWIAYVLWFCLGVFGVHHFYLGKIGRGIGYLFTFGWLTVGLWIDLFTLPSQTRQINTRILAEHGLAAVGAGTTTINVTMPPALEQPETPSTGTA